VSLDLELQIACDPQGLPAQTELLRWAESALEGTSDAAQLVIRVVDTEESAGLNQRFRGRPGPTNVLSFPFRAPPPAASGLLGDLVICAPVVRHEAREQGKLETAHWAHMVVHGVLHLVGYDHQTSEEAGEMEALETGILAGLGFPDPYRAENGSGPA
jgi:probable rRNA maturation factor